MGKVSFYQQILIEQSQNHDTRIGLFESLEKLLERPVVSFFTSFKHPVMIENTDSDMIEDVLSQMDLSKGLALLVNSPGGNGLASERIINICRSYSGTGEFWAIVPSRAKSAATMIAFGASKILMSKTAELGPIDPQIFITRDNIQKRFSLWNIVQDYEELFNKATTAKGQNLEPYLQQLQHYDSKEIKEFKAAIALAEDIAIRALMTGMLNKKQKQK
jgi:ClpP class serine protease